MLHDTIIAAVAAERVAAARARADERRLQRAVRGSVRARAAAALYRIAAQLDGSAVPPVEPRSIQAAPVHADPGVMLDRAA